MREVEFSSDATTWPPVEHVDVINYLIFTPSSYTSDQLKKYKSLDAYKFFQDGWIKHILHKKFDDLHLLLAKVGTGTVLGLAWLSNVMTVTVSVRQSQCHIAIDV